MPYEIRHDYQTVIESGIPTLDEARERVRVLDATWSDGSDESVLQIHATGDSYPTHCETCESELVEGARAHGDYRQPDYPHCRACSSTGAVAARARVDELQAIVDASEGRLQAMVWNGGGGCFNLVVWRAEDPEWGDIWERDESVADRAHGWEPTGKFVPFVCCSQAYRPIDAYAEQWPHLLKGDETDSEWTMDSGLAEIGEPYGAVFYATLDAWEGGSDFERMPTQVPLDMPGIAAFAMKHLFPSD